MLAQLTCCGIRAFTIEDRVRALESKVSSPLRQDANLTHYQVVLIVVCFGSSWSNEYALANAQTGKR